MVDSPTAYRKIAVSDWRQFGEISIDLSEKVTILTGVNGSGKTTLLRLLAISTGEHFPFLGTPRYSAETGRFEWLPGIFKSIIDKIQIDTSQHQIGSISYSNGHTSPLNIDRSSGSAQVAVNILSAVNINGFLISSHRPTFVYDTVSELSIQRRTKSDAYGSYYNTLRSLQSHTGKFLHSENIAVNLKNSLLNWAYVGYGSEVAPRDVELVENYENFQNILRQMFPSELRFKKFEVRSGSEIVFVCENGEFLLETASGGITSLIHLAWMIFNFDTGQPSTVLIDEIENHLHPSLQRIVVPNLSRAFPNIRFVITSHSPLVVSSVRDAKVYALTHREDGKIVDQQLDFSRDAGTANDILHRVLGVPVTIPLWAEGEFNRIVERYASMSVNEIDLKDFRTELEQNGLSRFVLTGVDKLLEAKQ